jgi:hypothetical protein
MTLIKLLTVRVKAECSGVTVKSDTAMWPPGRSRLYAFFNAACKTGEAFSERAGGLVGESACLPVWYHGE